MDVRCGSKKHGAITEDGNLEVKCDSRFCGAGAGTVVLHTFDVTNGELVKTVMFKNPGRGELRDGADNGPTAVRHP